MRLHPVTAAAPQINPHSPIEIRFMPAEQSSVRAKARYGHLRALAGVTEHLWAEFAQWPCTIGEGQP